MCLDAQDSKKHQSTVHLPHSDASLLKWDNKQVGTTPAIPWQTRFDSGNLSFTRQFHVISTSSPSDKVPAWWLPSFLSETSPWPSTMMAQGSSLMLCAAKPTPNHTSFGPSREICATEFSKSSRHGRMCWMHGLTKRVSLWRAPLSDLQIYNLYKGVSFSMLFMSNWSFSRIDLEAKHLCDLCDWVESGCEPNWPLLKLVMTGRMEGEFPWKLCEMNIWMPRGSLNGGTWLSPGSRSLETCFLGSPYTQWGHLPGPTVQAKNLEEQYTFNQTMIYIVVSWISLVAYDVLHQHGVRSSGHVHRSIGEDPIPPLAAKGILSKIHPRWEGIQEVIYHHPLLTWAALWRTYYLTDPPVSKVFAQSPHPQVARTSPHDLDRSTRSDDSS